MWLHSFLHLCYIKHPYHIILQRNPFFKSSLQQAINTSLILAHKYPLQKTPKTQSIRGCTPSVRRKSWVKKKVMQAHFLAGKPVILTLIVALLLQTAFVLCGFPTTLTLERGYPHNHHHVELSELKYRDGLRHPRILQSVASVVDFPVQGTYDPFRVG